MTRSKKNQHVETRGHLFWKVFTWLLIFGLFLYCIFTDFGERSSIGIIYFAFVLISAAGVYSYAYRKRLLFSIFWKVYLFLFAAYYTLSTSLTDWSDYPLEETLFDVVGMAALSIPLCIAIFLYAFRSSEVWLIAKTAETNKVPQDDKTFSRVLLRSLKLKRKEILIAVSLIFAFFLLIMGGMRIVVAWGITNRLDDIASNGYTFSEMPRLIVSNAKVAEETIDIGYATLAFPRAEIDSVTTFAKGNGVWIKGPNVSLSSTYPKSCDPTVFKPYFGNDILNPTTFTPKDDALEKFYSKLDSDNPFISFRCSYPLSLWSERLPRKGFFELFFDRSITLRMYMVSITLSGYRVGSNPARMETAFVNALIRKVGDGVRIANIWSKNGKISLELNIKSKTPAMLEKLTTDVTSSFKFTMDELPDDTALKQHIRKSLEGHERYKPEKARGPKSNKEARPLGAGLDNGQFSEVGVRRDP